MPGSVNTTGKGVTRSSNTPSKHFCFHSKPMMIRLELFLQWKYKAVPEAKMAHELYEMPPGLKPGINNIVD